MIFPQPYLYPSPYLYPPFTSTGTGERVSCLPPTLPLPLTLPLPSLHLYRYERQGERSSPNPIVYLYRYGKSSQPRITMPVLGFGLALFAAWADNKLLGGSTQLWAWR